MEAQKKGGPNADTAATSKTNDGLKADTAATSTSDLLIHIIHPFTQAFSHMFTHAELQNDPVLQLMVVLLQNAIVAEGTCHGGMREAA